MADDPKCPQCKSEYSYADGAMWVCPECSFEWSAASVKKKVAAPTTPATDVKDPKKKVPPKV